MWSGFKKEKRYIISSRYSGGCVIQTWTVYFHWKTVVVLLLLYLLLMIILRTVGFHVTDGRTDGRVGVLNDSATCSILLIVGRESGA